MRAPHNAILASFPWLTMAEVDQVVSDVSFDMNPGESAQQFMFRIGAALDATGLPPTSSLLLAIAGRGSKGTAVTVSRAIARARFERARDTPLPLEANEPFRTEQGEIESLLRSVASKLADNLQTPAAGSVPASGAILAQLEAITGEMRWLRSTIDTERQLSRYHKQFGALPEPDAARTPASTAEKRGLVSNLTRSLEQSRYRGTFETERDMADGAQE